MAITLEKMQEIVRRAFEDSNQTQVEFAESIGVAQSEISHALNHAPTNRVAKRFGYRATWVKIYEEIKKDKA